MSILPENYENERPLLPMFSSFMKEFKLNQLFRKCNIGKEKGIPVKDVFQAIFLLAFTGKSFSSFLHARNSVFQGKKDTIYRFLQKTSGNWRKFLFLLSSQVVTEALLPLTVSTRLFCPAVARIKCPLTARYCVQDKKGLRYSSLRIPQSSQSVYRSSFSITYLTIWSSIIFF